MDLEQLGTISMAVGGGGVSVGAVVWYLLRSLISDLKAQILAMRAEGQHLREEVQELREREIAGLARRLARVEETEATCPIRQIAEKIDNLIGWTKRLDGRVEPLLGQIAEQRAAAAAINEWLRNLDRSHNDLARELHGHIARDTHHG